MIACPYQDLFPYIKDNIHEKWNTEWDEKHEKLKEIKTYTRPWKENNRCRKNGRILKKTQSWSYINDPCVFD